MSLTSTAGALGNPRESREPCQNTRFFPNLPFLSPMRSSSQLASSCRLLSAFVLKYCLKDFPSFIFCARFCCEVFFVSTARASGSPTCARSWLPGPSSVPAPSQCQQNTRKGECSFSTSTSIHITSTLTISSRYSSLRHCKKLDHKHSPDPHKNHKSQRLRLHMHLILRIKQLCTICDNLHIISNRSTREKTGSPNGRAVVRQTIKLVSKNSMIFACG